jgi:hypothetical protein
MRTTPHAMLSPRSRYCTSLDSPYPSSTHTLPGHTLQSGDRSPVRLHSSFSYYLSFKLHHTACWSRYSVGAVVIHETPRHEIQYKCTRTAACFIHARNDRHDREITVNAFGDTRTHQRFVLICANIGISDILPQPQLGAPWIYMLCAMVT